MPVLKKKKKSPKFKDLVGFIQLFKKEVSSKGWIISGKFIYLWKTEGVYQTDYLTINNQVMQINWLKITFLGEATTAIRLGTKSSFADWGPSTSDSLGIYCLLKKSLSHPFDQTLSLRGVI